MSSKETSSIFLKVFVNLDDHNYNPPAFQHARINIHTNIIRSSGLQFGKGTLLFITCYDGHAGKKRTFCLVSQRRKQLALTKCKSHDPVPVGEFSVANITGQDTRSFLFCWTDSTIQNSIHQSYQSHTSDASSLVTGFKI